MRQHDYKPGLLRRVRRAVVKIGSNVLTDGHALRVARIHSLVRQMAETARDHELVVVSSGAVAAGVAQLERRRTGLEWRQAAAAIGQPTLMSVYARSFARHGRTVAQVLLTHGDLADRRRQLNARHTLRRLLALGVVPIVNENDTVSVEELKFGDNDDLSALTATLVEADLLVILTDVAGLFDADPRLHPGAKRIRVATAVDPRLDTVAGPATRGVGTGGMLSKIAAARIAAAAGISSIIADGTSPSIVRRVFDPGMDVGTLLRAEGDRLTRRKHWIAHTLKPQGAIHVDRGAEEALARGGRSLLPSGVARVEGRFEMGDCVRLIGPAGVEFARGLANYGSADVVKLVGAHTREIESRLGYKGSDEVVHRDDLVMGRGNGPA